MENFKDTEQIWPGPGNPGPGPYQRPGGPGAPGQPWQHPAGLQAHLARDKRKALRWTIGIMAAVLLAGGGLLAGMSLTGNVLSSTPTANTAGPGTTGTGPGNVGGSASADSSQAALLASVLNAAGSPQAAFSAAPALANGDAGTGPAMAGTGAGNGPGTGPAFTGQARSCAKILKAARAARLGGHPWPAGALHAAAGRCRFVRHAILRFFLLRGVDGQFTFRTAAGTLKTIAFERGTIESVSSGNSIVVQASDGTTGTWDLVSNTVVRNSSGKVGQSSLAAGEKVWVGGPVISGAKDARLIFLNPPDGTT